MTTLKSGKQKRQSFCKDCMREYQKEWREANPENVREAKRRHRLTHGDEIRAAKRRLWQSSDKYREYQRQWHENNREYVREREKKYAGKKREWKMLREYGMDWPAFDALLQKQKGLCPICNRDLTNPEERRHIDHCHKTKKVRGILCQRCNQALGLLADEPERLRAALRYLNR